MYVSREAPAQHIDKASSIVSMNAAKVEVRGDCQARFRERSAYSRERANLFALSRAASSGGYGFPIASTP